MRSCLCLLVVMLLGGALLWADDMVRPPGEAEDTASLPAAEPTARLATYRDLVAARSRLLLRLRLLRARRYTPDVASNPGKGEQLERDIRSAFGEVVALYDRYLKDHPDDARAHYDLGEHYYSEVQEESRAAELWRRAIELDPTFDEAHNSLAVQCADSAQHEKALRHIRKAIELNPDVAVYHFNAATFYFNFRLAAMELFGWDLPRVWKEMMAEYERSLELDPANFTAAEGCAQCFYFAHYFGVGKQYDEAQAAWERVLPLAPDRGQKVMVLTNLARFSLLAGDRDAARRYLEQALQLEPRDPAARLLKRKLEDGESIALPPERQRPGVGSSGWLLPEER